MAQLNVRELRKQKQRKKRKYFYFFKFSCNFEKPESLNRKGFAKTQPNIFRALVRLAATLNSDFKHLGNHRDSVAIYLRKRSRERSHVM